MRHLLVSSFAALLCSAPAHADNVADINKLVRAGQLPAALAKVDVGLAQQPKDAQLRFIKGMILSEQGKANEAIAVFQKLTEDFPELPEPYNNLAVLYAGLGQYDKARVALERAIRTSPAYATAHENLGDVYAKLASQSYDKAMQLLDTNQHTPPKSKLAMVRTLKAPGYQPAPAPALPAAPPQPAIAASPATARPAAPELVHVKPAQPAAAAPAAAASAVPSKAADQEAINAAVSQWARAWSAQDMKNYLNAYAPTFQTPRGQSRQAWAADRSAKIEGKEHIKVTVESPQISVNGNTATVKFRQIYVSDRLKANSRKTLVMEKQGSKWLIRQEQSGS